MHLGANLDGGRVARSVEVLQVDVRHLRARIAIGRLLVARGLRLRGGAFAAAGAAAAVAGPGPSAGCRLPVEYSSSPSLPALRVWRA